MTTLTKKELTADTCIQRSETVLYSELSDEIAMMDIEHGQYYGVDGVGASIWLLLEKPTSIGNICQQLVSEYDVTTETCAEEVLQFVANLQEHGIVEVAA